MRADTAGSISELAESMDVSSGLHSMMLGVMMTASSQDSGENTHILRNEELVLGLAHSVLALQVAVICASHNAL